MRHRPNAIIVGGGIAGLATGIALMAEGLEIAVLEKRPRAASAGTGLVLWPNGTKVLQSLGLRDGLEAIGAPLLRVDVRSMDDGIDLGTVDVASFSADTNAHVYVVDRNYLKELLLSRLPESCIHYSVEVQSIDSTPEFVKAISSTGEAFSGNVLIGADGINSVTRSLLFGEVAVQQCGVYNWMGITQAIPEFTCVGTGLEFLGPGIRAGFMPLNDGNVYFRFTCALTSSTLKNTSAFCALKEIFSDKNIVTQKYLSQINEPDITFVEEADIDPLSMWAKGRVCLVGDAAHAMTPALGQGANQALEDAYVLSKILTAAASFAGALEQYCNSRVARANGILIKSKNKTRLFMQSRSALLKQWYDDMENLSSKDSMKSLFDLVAGGPLG